jgi:ABC-type oligopeptide transport system substrate-binding subunit
MDRVRVRAVALTAAAALFAVACGTGGGGGTTEELASDQTLNFAIQDDVSHLDPAQVDAAVDITFLQNVFDGLIKYDEKLKIVPDAAQSLPDVSADGLTYTFHLRKDVKFSNGDAVTAKDWIYTFTRTLRLNQAYASNLEAIKGSAAVEDGSAKTLSGLSAPDDYTLKAVLDEPAGFWLSQLAMPTAALVLDQKVLESTGAPDSEKWTQNPATYIGTGPFKMTQRVPKQVMEFAAVPNWWGGSTGALKKLHVDIGVDLTSIVKKFEAGGYDIVGMANNAAGPDDVLRFQSDPTKKKFLTLIPGARTTGVGFNFVTGPFADKAGATPGTPTNTGAEGPGLPGRAAFSQAVDRAQLADVACAHTITCIPATGGPITKGFKGYLGDNKDVYAKFDPNTAKANLQKAGGAAKFAGLTYRYNTNPSNDKIAQNLQAQWKANLGLDVQIGASDFPTLQADRKKKIVTLGRESWSIDYDNPQDWFDNLFNCTQAKVQRGNDQAYCNPSFDQLTQKANTQTIDKALPDYTSANQQLTKDIVWATMIYGQAPFMTQTYLKGWGYNSLYDYPWTDIKLLKH